MIKVRHSLVPPLSNDNSLPYSVSVLVITRGDNVLLKLNVVFTPEVEREYDENLVELRGYTGAEQQEMFNTVMERIISQQPIPELNEVGLLAILLRDYAATRPSMTYSGSFENSGKRKVA